MAALGSSALLTLGLSWALGHILTHCLLGAPRLNNHQRPQTGPSVP